MKRDDDRLRTLMFEIEAHEDPLYVFFLSFDSGRSERETYYHLRLLCDAGFLEETGETGGEFRMTNQGHDFLASVRDDTVWRKTRTAAAHLSGTSLGILHDIAVGYVRQKLRELGVPIE